MSTAALCATRCSPTPRAAPMKTCCTATASRSMRFMWKSPPSVSMSTCTQPRSKCAFGTAAKCTKPYATRWRTPWLRRVRWRQRKPRRNLRHQLNSTALTPIRTRIHFKLQNQMDLKSNIHLRKQLLISEQLADTAFPIWGRCGQTHLPQVKEVHPSPFALSLSKGGLRQAQPERKWAQPEQVLTLSRRRVMQPQTSPPATGRWAGPSRSYKASTSWPRTPRV